jgi:hypothetical protein
VTLRIKLLCDGEYRYGLCVNQVLLNPPETHARQQATELGWMTKSDRHFCPSCQREGRHNTGVTR